MVFMQQIAFTQSRIIRIIALMWVVFVDSLGSGLAFSVFALLFFDSTSSFFEVFSSDYSRHIAYGILLGIYNFCMFCASPFIGFLSDKYGRKPVLVLSMCGLILGFLLSSLGCFYAEISMLVLGRIVSGVTAGSLSVAQAAVIDMSNDKTKSFYLALIVISNCLGFSIGPLLGHILLNTSLAPLGTLTFIAGFVLGAIGLFLILIFFQENRESRKSDQRKLVEGFSDIKNIFFRRYTRGYILSFSLAMLAFCTFFSYLPVFFNYSKSWGSVIMGYILSLLVICLSISTSFGGKYFFNGKDTNIKNRNLAFAQVSQFTTFLILSFCVISLPFNTLLFVLVTLLFGLIYIGLLTIVSDVTPSDVQGSVMGVLSSIGSLAWAIAAWSAGWLAHFGKGVPFLACASFAICSFIIMRKLKNFRRYK